MCVGRVGEDLKFFMASFITLASILSSFHITLFLLDFRFPSSILFLTFYSRAVTYRGRGVLYEESAPSSTFGGTANFLPTTL